MTADPASASIKERAESQIISELVQDRSLRALFPKKQNEDGKQKLPRLAVVVAVGKEISPGAAIYTMTASVEVYFKYPDDNSAGLDRIMRKIADRLAYAQAQGNYGIILDGEQATQFAGDTIRKRAYQARLLAG